MRQGSLNRAERLSLAALYLFTVAAVLGYGIFALHPERLPDTDFARSFFANSFGLSSRVHILLSTAVLSVAFFLRASWRWLIALGAVFVLSFLAEHIGTGTGFPFSGYRYTSLLGPRIGERVPWLIPVSWFLMAAPSWIMARRSFPTRTVPRVLFASYLLMLWDVALDPAMSYLVTYWIWETPGPYYGMPWLNFAGWYGTGILLMSALEFLDRRIDWAGSVPVRWALLYHVAIVLMPLGMLVAAGAWVAVFATLAGGLLAVVVHRLAATTAGRARAGSLDLPEPATEASS
jgi:putative membrane protein